jgi:hypothetical protein
MEKTSPGRLAEKSWLKILFVDLLEKKHCLLAKKVKRTWPRSTRANTPLDLQHYNFSTDFLFSTTFIILY